MAGRSGRRVQENLMLLAGLAMGAGLMALADPGRGARRRAWVRGKIAHGLRVTGREAGKLARNAANNLYGALAEARSTVRNRRVDDERLEDRVKAQIGHVLSHFTVVVHATSGHVVIDGPVLRGERQKIARRLEETRGVRSYDLRVSEHDSADEVARIARVAGSRFRTTA